jgi:WhiB family transcriptional regulator, redox-sensing transcriptional regulator
MTSNGCNFRVAPGIAMLPIRIGDGAGAGRRQATDIETQARNKSRWNSTWMALGKCRDMDPALFFPSDEAGRRAAQRICAVCPVKIPCLEYSLDNRMDEGVWGGTSEQERYRMLRQRPIVKRLQKRSFFGPPS